MTKKILVLVAMTSLSSTMCGCRTRRITEIYRLMCSIMPSRFTSSLLMILIAMPSPATSSKVIYDVFVGNTGVRRSAKSRSSNPNVGF
ncbi:unnamed protein product [Rhodiola kirilowii]